jgi:hypothetical protein
MGGAASINDNTLYGRKELRRLFGKDYNDQLFYTTANGKGFVTGTQLRNICEGSTTSSSTVP